jgi:DNA repair protein RecO (recombination protein O)
MAAEKLEALVLRTYNLTESSKIVVLLTSLKGKVRAVAKGVRRAKSKFGSALEPITYVEAEVYYKENRDLQNLAQAVTRESFPSIRSDLKRLGVASVMCELMDQFVQENEESSRPFVLLFVSLKTLESMSKNYDSLRIAFYLKVLETSGLLPEMGCCLRCSGELKNHAYLDAGSGGILCSRCSAGMGEKVRTGSLTIMQRLHSIDWPLLERTRVPSASVDEIVHALEAYIAHHTGRRLKATKFLHSISKLKQGASD